MKYDIRKLRLISNEKIADGIFDMRLEYGDGEIPVACGQFAHVYVPGKSLRRPISVCDARGGELRLVYQVKGEGTKIMSQMKAEKTPLDKEQIELTENYVKYLRKLDAEMRKI